MYVIDDTYKGGVRGTGLWAEPRSAPAAARGSISNVNWL